MSVVTLLLAIGAAALAQDPVLDRPDTEIVAAGPAVVPRLIERLTLQVGDPPEVRARDARLLLLLGALGADAVAAVPRLCDGYAAVSASQSVGEWLPELAWALGEVGTHPDTPQTLLTQQPEDLPRERLMTIELILLGKLRLGRRPSCDAIVAAAQSAYGVEVVSAVARARDVADATPALLDRLRQVFWSAWYERGPATPSWHALKAWSMIEAARSPMKLEPNTPAQAFLLAAQLRHPSVLVRREAARALSGHAESLLAMLPELLAGVADPDPAVAAATAQAISLGSDDLAPLTQALSDRRASAEGELARTLDRALARLQAARQRQRQPAARAALLAAWLDRRVEQDALDAVLAGQPELGDVLALFEVLPLASGEQSEQILAALSALPPDAAARCNVPARLIGMRGKPPLLADLLAAAIAQHTVRAGAGEEQLRQWLSDPSPAVQVLALAALAARNACSPETESVAAKLLVALQAPPERDAPRPPPRSESDQQFERTLGAARLVARAKSLADAVRAPAAALLLRAGEADAQLAGLDALATMADITPAVDDTIAMLRSSRDEVTRRAIAVLARADVSAARAPLAELAAGDGDLAQAAAAALARMRPAAPAAKPLPTEPPAPAAKLTELRDAEARASLPAILGGRAIDVMVSDAYRARWNASVDLSRLEEALRQLGALQDEHGVFCFGALPATPNPRRKEPRESADDLIGRDLREAMVLVAATAKVPFVIGPGIEGKVRAAVDPRDCRAALRALAPSDVIVGERDGVLLIVKRQPPPERPAAPWLFDDVDASTALPMIAATGKARLRIDPRVHGKVTLRATRLHWRDALEVAARAVGAEVIARDDGSLVIAPRSRLGFPADATESNVPVGELGAVCRQIQWHASEPLTLAAAELEEVAVTYHNLPIPKADRAFARLLAAAFGLDMIESDGSAVWRRRTRE